MSRYEPLKITAWLRCGVITDTHLPIDAILFYSAMAQLNGPQLVTLPGRNPDAKTASLPLKHVEVDGVWFHAASFAQWGPHADGQAFWTKRFDQKTAHLVDFRGRRGKVIVGQGRYKAYRMPVFYRHALWVSWYVVGDYVAIQRLLAPMTHIGKKTAQGFGRVIRWEVEPWDHDWSVYGPGGRLMRAIPERGGILYGIRPSYWDRRNQVPCRLPEQDG